ncbi:DUF4328 domain-containing protein [Streptomyces sp. NPDC014684]|uniref:DUF4328 domain-containing protein n=1 Tax=Streptomyces sp. NPDC014684 TaxID=3364880 RepID=UPI0037031250
MSVARLRPPRTLGRLACALLVLVAVTDLLAVGAGYHVYREAGDLAAGTGIGATPSPRAARADHLYAAAGVLQTVTWLVCAVVFLVWLYRVRVNAEVFRPDGHSKARAWVIAGWVVPLANFWFPRRVVLDVWDSSGPLGAPPRHALVNLWWALWLVSTGVGPLMANLYDSAVTAPEFRNAALQVMAADAVDIVAAVLAARLVLRLTRMQQERILAGPVFVPALG